MHRSYEYSYDRFSKRLQADPPTTTATIYEHVHVDAAAVTATMTVAETADTALRGVDFAGESLLSNWTAQT